MKEAFMPERILNDRYALDSKVGEGGMAITYRARDLLLNRTVAIKMMREQFTTDAKFIERFRREAQAAAQISHENIANVYDTGRADGAHYIVMEFVEGTDLKQRLRADGPMPVVTALEIGRQIAAALEAAHGKGLVHRDIKPHNILLNREGAVKVTDFGIAKVVSDLEDTGVIIGSVHYLAPEQARGDATAPSCDIYALGCVLFEMLTGRTVFEGENAMAVAHKQIYEQPPSPRSLRAEIPAPLEAFILRCLEKDPQRRYQSAAEAKAALVQLGNIFAQEDTVVIPLPAAADATIVYRKPLHTPPPPASKPEPITPPPAAPAADAGRQGGGGASWAIAILFVVLASAVAYGVFAMLGQRGMHPPPVPPDPPATVLMPNLLNATEQEAAEQLAHLHIKAQAQYEFNASVTVGTVFLQDPAAGEVTTGNRLATYTGSQGPPSLVIPDVIKKSQDEAKRIIREEAPAIAFNIQSEESARVSRGMVIRTEPAAGASVDLRPKSVKVTLVLSKGEPAAVTETYRPGNAPDPGEGSTEVYVKIELETPEGAEPRTLDAQIYKVGEKIPDQVFQRKGTDTAIIHMFIGKDEADTEWYSEHVFKSTD